MPPNRPGFFLVLAAAIVSARSAAGASLIERPAAVRLPPAAASASDLSQAPLSIGDPYSTRAGEIRGILEQPFPTGPGALSVLDEPLGTIDGFPYRKLSGGGENMGLYLIHRNEEPTVVKTLYPPGSDLAARGDGEGHRPAEEQWRWAKVGALFSAPDVRRAGLLRTSEGDLFFIELEALFSGREGLSLKDDVVSSERKSDVAQPRAEGRRPTQEMADILVSTLEHGIVPRDSDFFLSRGRQVALIDTNRWYMDRDARFESEMAAVAVEVRKWLVWASDSQEAYLFFYVDFLTALKRSARLDEGVKLGILRATFWGADDSAYRAARAVYDAL